MSNPKPAMGADWTQLLTDPELITHLGELLQTYREARPEKRDQELLAAMRRIKQGDKASNSDGAAKTEAAPARSEMNAVPEPATPVATDPAASPPFEPDIFTPAPSWEDRRRYPRLKCFVAVELRVEGAANPIWGNLANTSMGGCFVETATPVPARASVEIGLWLANGKLWIKGIILNGVVTRSTPSFGIRIKFADLEPTARESLRQFLRFVEGTTKGYRSEHAYLANLKR
ncbi:MAG TPA: PilZ domain-containing protein [Terriglobales bacterium]|nr:PilZ domain-containing protein [Terriglobales bacterium]